MNLEILILNVSGKDILEKYPLNIGRDKTTDHLKKLVEPKIDGKILSITYLGDVLDPNKTLTGSGVENNGQIKIITDVQELLINIIVQLISSSANSKPTNIRCSVNTTTEKLINLINNKGSFPTSGAYYTCNGKNLENGKTLKEQNIANNATVSVGVRMRGG